MRWRELGWFRASGWTCPPGPDTGRDASDPALDECSQRDQDSSAQPTGRSDFGGLVASLPCTAGPAALAHRLDGLSQVHGGRSAKSCSCRANRPGPAEGGRAKGPTSPGSAILSSIRGESHPRVPDCPLWLGGGAGVSQASEHIVSTPLSLGSERQRHRAPVMGAKRSLEGGRRQEVRSLRRIEQEDANGKPQGDGDEQVMHTSATPPAARDAPARQEGRRGWAQEVAADATCAI